MAAAAGTAATAAASGTPSLPEYSPFGPRPALLPSTQTASTTAPQRPPSTLASAAPRCAQPAATATATDFPSPPTALDHCAQALPPPRSSPLPAHPVRRPPTVTVGACYPGSPSPRQSRAATRELSLFSVAITPTQSGGPPATPLPPPPGRLDARPRRPTRRAKATLRWPRHLRPITAAFMRVRVHRGTRNSLGAVFVFSLLVCNTPDVCIRCTFHRRSRHPRRLLHCCRRLPRSATIRPPPRPPHAPPPCAAVRSAPSALRRCPMASADRPQRRRRTWRGRRGSASLQPQR